MSRGKTAVRKFTLGLVSVIFGCLLVATLGVTFDAPWLAYFWYAALAGIFSLVILTVMLAINWLWNRLINHTVNLNLNPWVHDGT